MRKTIKIVIADDHEIYRAGLKAMLDNEENIEVIGEAGNGFDLVDLITSNQPDLAIIDIKMPVMNGIEATKKIKNEYDKTKVIALTMFNNEEFLSEMLIANTNGFLLKTASGEEIIKAINVVNEGGVFYCKETAKNMKYHFEQLNKIKINHEKKVAFTPREIEIINLICQQLTTKEIATKLSISDRTVDSHRNTIQQKIEARNMVGVVLYAIKHGLFKVYSLFSCINNILDLPSLQCLH